MHRVSMIPFVSPWSPWAWRDPCDVQHKTLKNNFALEILEHDIEPFSTIHFPNYRYFPMRIFNSDKTSTREGEMQGDPKKFEVFLDVKQFTPDELSVKTVNNCIIINGKHKEMIDEHGFVSREFTRRYVLPPGVLPENVTSTITPDRILLIQAPIPVIEANERVVPIVQEVAAAVEEVSAPDNPST